MADYDEQVKKERGVLARVQNSIRNLIGNPAKHYSVKDVRAKETVLHQGFLRKKNTNNLMGKAMDSMNIRWKMFYVIITDKFIYYFKSDLSSSFVGKFSLYGYNVVKRVPVSDPTKCPEYSLVVVHAAQDTSLYKNHYFAATHQEDCRVWIAKIRKGLMAANSSLVPGIKRDRTESSLDITQLEDPIYPSHEFHRSDGDKDSNNDVESDVDDYDFIPDMDDAPPPPTPTRPKKPGYSPTSPSTESYIDFADSKQGLHKAPYEKRPPLPPLPDDPPSATTPSSIERKPAFAMALNDLESARKKMSQRDASLKDTMPKNPAPNTPINQQPFRPPIGKKPVQPVRPRLLPEKIFWNQSKEEGNRQIKVSPVGVFLVRRGSIPGQLVLVISSGEGSLHSLRVNQYYDGTMGLKSENAATEADKFSDVRNLVTFYKSNDIHLQNGLIQIRLKSPHAQCETELQDEE